MPTKNFPVNALSISFLGQMPLGSLGSNPSPTFVAVDFSAGQRPMADVYLLKSRQVFDHA